MINNHHPGHKKNYKSEIAGGIDDIKLRMHPLAAVIATETKLEKEIMIKRKNYFNL